MDNLRKQRLFVLFTAALLAMLTGCARHSKSEHYYLVAIEHGCSVLEDGRGWFCEGRDGVWRYGGDARAEGIRSAG